MFNEFKIILHNGKQFIPQPKTASVSDVFRGRPIISPIATNDLELVAICPSGAIMANPIRIDLGRCLFCGECALRFPEKICFTNEVHLSANSRDGLIVTQGQDRPLALDQTLIQPFVKKLFGHSLKLRQVSAGGDNSAELELNACSNANFDMGRYGIEFVASPRHADGILITGPITSNMAQPLEMAYDAVPDPKLLILCGTDAISGGMFQGSDALNRSFLNGKKVDLYIAGNPPHPLTVINGLLDLITP